MRRYAITLILLAALLVFGGLAISSNFSIETLLRGYYVPTFSSDPKTAQTQALIFLGSVAAILALTIGMGVGMAVAFYRITKMQAVQSAEAPSPAKPQTPTRPASKSAVETHRIPLSDTRSLTIFWAVLIALTGGFLAINYWGQKLGYIPNLLATPAGNAGVSAPPAPGSGGSEIEVLQAEFDALPPGDAAAGQTVFTSAGCVACHSLEPEVKIVGPSQAGVATRAATRKPGYSAELYLYESIINPNAHLVEGFQPDVMPKTFKDTLQPQDLANVIAFLLTLE